MITVRLSKPEESKSIVEWMDEQDPYSKDCFGPNTVTLAAENGTLRMAMPIQAVLMIQSMPRNPKNRHRDTVVSLVELLKGVVSIAKAGNVKDIYFVATTKGIEEQAEHFGFERVNFPVYRRRV